MENFNNSWKTSGKFALKVKLFRKKKNFKLWLYQKFLKMMLGVVLKIIVCCLWTLCSISTIFSKQCILNLRPQSLVHTSEIDNQNVTLKSLTLHPLRFSEWKGDRNESWKCSTFRTEIERSCVHMFW